MLASATDAATSGREDDIVLFARFVKPALVVFSHLSVVGSSQMHSRKVLWSCAQMGKQGCLSKLTPNYQGNAH